MKPSTTTSRSEAGSRFAGRVRPRWAGRRRHDRPVLRQSPGGRAPRAGQVRLLLGAPTTPRSTRRCVEGGAGDPAPRARASAAHRDRRVLFRVRGDPTAERATRPTRRRAKASAVCRRQCRSKPDVGYGLSRPTRRHSLHARCRSPRGVPKSALRIPIRRQWRIKRPDERPQQHRIRQPYCDDDGRQVRADAERAPAKATLARDERGEDCGGAISKSRIVAMNRSSSP